MVAEQHTENEGYCHHRSNVGHKYGDSEEVLKSQKRHIQQVGKKDTEYNLRSGPHNSHNNRIVNRFPEQGIG